MKPCIGYNLQLWRGCYVSQRDGIALLGSVALHGYHSKAKYEWSRDGVPVNGECTPLYYCCHTGKVSCLVSACGEIATTEFLISGIYSTCIVYLCSYYACYGLEVITNALPLVCISTHYGYPPTNQMFVFTYTYYHTSAVASGSKLVASISAEPPTKPSL